MSQGLAHEGRKTAALAVAMRASLAEVLRAEVAAARARAAAALVPTTVLDQWDLVMSEFVTQAARGQRLLSVTLPSLGASDVDQLRSLLSVGDDFRSVFIIPESEGAGYKLGLTW